jgi:hypothetical protein
MCGLTYILHVDGGSVRFRELCPIATGSHTLSKGGILPLETEHLNTLGLNTDKLRDLPISIGSPMGAFLSEFPLGSHS